MSHETATAANHPPVDGSAWAATVEAIYLHSTPLERFGIIICVFALAAWGIRYWRAKQSRLNGNGGYRGYERRKEASNHSQNGNGKTTAIYAQGSYDRLKDDIKELRADIVEVKQDITYIILCLEGLYRDTGKKIPHNPNKKR